MVLTMDALKRMHSSSMKAVEGVEEIVKRARVSGKLSLGQKLELSQLVTQSKNVQEKASAEYLRLVDNEKAWIALEKQRKPGTPSPSTMLKEIIENHAWIGKHLTHSVGGKPILKHLSYGSNAFQAAKRRISFGRA